jgi:alpha-tubulin suppressor-like RCC1 family protein
MKLDRTWTIVACALFAMWISSQQTLAYELEAWGYDGSFLLSTNLPPGSDFVSIAAGEEHGVALKSDGTVVAWGNDASGQNAPPASLGTCIAIGAGGDTGYAIETAGTIVAWGSDYLGTVSLVPAGTYTAVDGGEFFAVALATNGSIAAWGSDSSSQVTNVPSGTDFVQVVAGDSHGVALRSDGSLASWGYPLATIGQPTSGVFTQVSAGHNYSLALKSDGSIVHWGEDPWGYGVDEVPAGNDFVEISAGYVHGLARKTDGSVVGWGAGTTTSGHPHWGQAMPPARNDFQAISGGLYWSLSMVGANDTVFGDGFESGDTLYWTLTSP